MKPQKIIWIVAFVVSFLSAAAICNAQTKIETVDGSVYEGGIISDTGNTIVLITDENKEIRILKSQVAIQESEAIRGAHFKNSFPLIGASFGTPAGLQLIGGYYFGPFGMRLEAGYLGKIYGGQINVFRNISSGRSFSHNIGLAAGYMQIQSPKSIRAFNGSYLYEYYENLEWTYVALEYDINISGFFASIGLSVGDGNFSSPQLLFQIGYVHEFKSDKLCLNLGY